MGHMAQTINALSLQIVTQQSSRHMPTWMNSPQPVTQQPTNMPTQSMCLPPLIFHIGNYSTVCTSSLLFAQQLTDGHQ
jgi:hypothetical protein